MRAVAAAAALLAVLGVWFAPVRAEPPSELYTLNCWGCHRPHAEGIPGSVPRLAHSMGYFLRVPGGRAFLVQVPGVAYSQLNDRQTAEVLNWLLVTFNRAQAPKNFKPFTASEVGRLRAHHLLDVKDTRKKLAERLAAMGYKVAPP